MAFRRRAPVNTGIVVLVTLLAGLAWLSLGLTLWQLWAGLRFPLHRPRESSSNSPAISLLKPLKGYDAATRECLESWFTQNYPADREILFGVADAADPVCDIVRDLIAQHPTVPARLIHCSKQFGANAKVSTLIHLEAEARGEILIISDADIEVPPNFLRGLVAPFDRGEVGLVCPFYQLAGPGGFAMRWESFAVNADFWAQVLQSTMLKRADFALGAVMAVRARTLNQIGGFRVLADYLADDYQLGHKIAATGAQVDICPEVVLSRSGTMTWRPVWAHQLRWARTIRVCQPLPYFMSILHNGTLWPLLWAVCNPAAAVGAGGMIAFRMLSAVLLERKLTRRFQISSIWMAPIKDLLQLPLWLAAFGGRTVTWRGRRYQVGGDGKLAPIP